MDSGPIEIATAINDNYLVPWLVTLQSLLAHTQRPLRLHLLHRSLGPESLRKIRSLVETIDYPIRAREGPLQSVQLRANLTLEAIFPLLLAEVLPPAQEKVLFLDADLLVLRDVGGLWDLDLGEKLLAAAGDQAIPTVSSSHGVPDYQELGIPPHAPYFNGGVLLLNLARWRRIEATPRTLHYLNTRIVDNIHQGALNALFWNDWMELPQGWNCIGGLVARRAPIPDDGVGIVHFAGRFKPWRFAIGGPFNPVYQEYLRELGETRRPEWREQLLSLYDRYLRPYLWRLESYLWKRHWI